MHNMSCVICHVIVVLFLLSILSEHLLCYVIESLSSLEKCYVEIMFSFNCQLFCFSVSDVLCQVISLKLHNSP